jgi:hypothetical protein
VAVFSEAEIDWRRIDVTAIITFAGVATVRVEALESCRDWLRSEQYHVVRLDLAAQISSVCAQLDSLFSWQEQFGYALSDHSERLPNLDALRDGFDVQISSGVGCVLELDGVDARWAQHPEWTAGLLAIVSEHSRFHLSLGRRFFALLPLPEGSSVVGAAFEQLAIPHFGWDQLGGRAG